MFAFADSFDPYAAIADAFAGYWDSGANPAGLQAGRFAGSQCVRWSSSAGSLTKSSAQNDSVHHLVVAVRNSGTLTGTSLYVYFQLLDGATAQCSVVLRSDGALLLTSGAANGTVLATYTGAISAQNTWTAFEIEVIVSNTVGGMRVRKNGNTANDYDSFTAIGNLDTATTANNFANKLTIATQSTPSGNIDIDDLIWRSDASSVPWIGDVRIIARMPASDVQAQFSRGPGAVQNTGVFQANLGLTAGSAWYMPLVAQIPGTVGSATLTFALAYTGNIKCSIYTSDGTRPQTVMASSNVVTNPGVGTATFTFASPPSVVAGTQYWLAFCPDTTLASCVQGRSTGNTSYLIAGTYASFPAFNPTGAAAVNVAPLIATWNITWNNNYGPVSEAQQDAATSYVYSSNPGDADFYGLAALSSTPQAVFGVTTRAFVQKSDAGARSGAVQLKSGGTTVASTSTALSSSWGWLWRVDTVDPNTGSAWTAVGVNAAQIGPTCTA